MNELFDQQITESLHRNANHASLPRPSFGDVRRRVRVRRQRNVVAMAVPAVLGVAAIGLRANGGSGSSVAGAGSNSVVDTSEAATSTSVAESTTTWGVGDVITSTTLPGDVIGGVVCLNASGDPANAFARGCQISVGGGKWLTAGKVSTSTFAMALKPEADGDAAAIAAALGISVQPLDASYLPTDVDLTNTAAGVVVVIGPDLPPSTVTPTTSRVDSSTVPTPLAADANLSADVARRVDLARPALAALGFPNDEYTTDAQGVTTLSASDPDRPNERTLVMTMRPGVAEVTPTTSNTTERPGKVSFKFQTNDGWIYTVEVDDLNGTALPTEAQLQALQVALNQ